MQLTQFTDYALRTLIYLTIHPEKTPIAKISESYGISTHHLVKVVSHLAKLGYVKTTRGAGGGIALAQDPKKINLGKAIKAIEPHFNLVECFDREQGTCCIIPVCKLKKILLKAQQDFLKSLSQYTLADITTNRQQLGKALGITIVSA